MAPEKPHGGILARLSSLVSSLHREPEFTCSDCEMCEHCGSPPNENCVVKAAQLERGDWKLRRRARALSCTVGPM
jgi:hypothetical protein